MHFKPLDGMDKSSKKFYLKVKKNSLEYALPIQSYLVYLTIRSRGRMDYESIAHEAIGRRGYSDS